MLNRRRFTSIALLLPMAAVLQGAEKNWQTGKLLSAEREEERGVQNDRETHRSSDDYGNSSSSSSETTRKSDLYVAWMYYKIVSGDKMYISRHMVNAPWVKTATSEVGKNVKFAIDKNKLYILDQDGKEVKTDVMKTSVMASKSSEPK